MRHVRSILLGALIAATWYGIAGATPPTEPAAPVASGPPTTVAGDAGVSGVVGPDVPVVEQPPPIGAPLAVSTPLIPVPTGCTAPPAPVAVFVGTLAATDPTTGRFEVHQIRAGSLDGYAVGTIVDVRYDDDVRFLRLGQQYLVGAIPDRITGVLHSKVRLPAPLFGGDAVIGVNDTNLACPRVEDGVKTLLVDGTEVDTGVLTPLKDAKKSVAKAILKPVAVAFIVLIVLASMKLLIFAMVRAARQRDDDGIRPPVEVSRDRQHVDAVAAADSETMGELNSR